MNAPVPRIVAVGDLTADLIVEVPELPIRADDFLIAEQMRLEPGGNANLLILLSRLGAAAVALGILGADLWGEQAFQILESEGADVSLIRREGTTTVALVLVDSHGRHSFVGSYGKGKPLAFGAREREAIAEADALFASGYSLAEERLRDLALEALEAAGRRGIPCFFDPGPAFAGLPLGVKRRALASSDVVLLNEEELQDLSRSGMELLLPPALSRIYAGKPGSESTAVPGSAAPADAAAPAGSVAATRPTAPADAAGRSGPRTVVMKWGAAGCRVYTDGPEGIAVPGLPVTVRDTTAAGDCFDAGYIWAHLGGRSLEECARLANCAGAAAVGKLGGGRNVPTAEELRGLISRAGGGIEI
jgi:ribokinase